MGTTYLADTPSGALHGTVLTHASLASDGAAATTSNIGAGIFRAPQAITIMAAWWEPTGADNGATSTASYRTIRLINAGQTGTGTTVLASINNTASQASNSTRAMTLATNSTNVWIPSATTGDIIAMAISGTVGGADATNTLVRAGQIHVMYKPI